MNMMTSHSLQQDIFLVGKYSTEICNHILPLAFVSTETQMYLPGYLIDKDYAIKEIWRNFLLADLHTDKNMSKGCLYTADKKVIIWRYSEQSAYFFLIFFHK